MCVWLFFLQAHTPLRCTSSPFCLCACVCMCACVCVCVREREGEREREREREREALCNVYQCLPVACKLKCYCLVNSTNKLFLFLISNYYRFPVLPNLVFIWIGRFFHVQTSIPKKCNKQFNNIVIFSH